MTRWIRLPERHPGVTIALVGLLFGVAYGASLIWLAKPGGRVVYGDALHHYVQLRSAVFDHDLRFTNEYVRMYGLTASNDDPELRWITDTNAGGYVRNLMPVGPAIVWAPGFLAVTAAVWLADASGASYPSTGTAGSSRRPPRSAASRQRLPACGSRFWRPRGCSERGRPSGPR